MVGWDFQIKLLEVIINFQGLYPETDLRKNIPPDPPTPKTEVKKNVVKKTASVVEKKIEKGTEVTETKSATCNVKGTEAENANNSKAPDSKRESKKEQVASKQEEKKPSVPENEFRGFYVAFEEEPKSNACDETKIKTLIEK